MNRVYEFNFDELNAADFLTLAQLQHMPFEPANMAMIILPLADRHTNTEVDRLPIEELGNFIQQFTAALVEHFAAMGLVRESRGARFKRWARAKLRLGR